MRRAGCLLSAALAACLALGAIALFLSGPLTTRAVQNPKISLDMDPSGNSYDPASNTMTVGTVDSCLASPEANPNTHVHTAQIVVENVEDLVGWQARLNYNGDEMRPMNVDFDPFLDAMTGQEVSFVNMPYDAMTKRHRNILGAWSIPTGVAGPQSALIGSTYFDTQDFPVSADTPPKSPPDDSSYRAANGGVLASVDFEVEGDQSGRTLFMQLDNDNPNPPGSKVVAFDGAGGTEIKLTSDQLNSGFHAEGAEACASVPMPTNALWTPTPTPPNVQLTPTPTPTPPYSPPPRSVADITVIGGEASAPESVKAGQPFDIRLSVTVANEGPDDADGELLASYGWDSSANCLTGPDYRMFWDLGHLAPSAVSQFDIRNEITCYGSSSPVTPARFYLGVTAYALAATDPNPKNNEWAVQRFVSIVGAAPMPTPAPVQDPPIDPIQVPDSPPSNPGVGGSSSGGSPSNDPAVAQAGVQTSAPAVLAAALPKTGEPGGEGQPTWLLVGVAGGVLGITGATAVAMRWLMARRG